MKVLIIEDELAAGEQLRKMIQIIRPEYLVVDQLESIEAAVSFLKQEPCPDLIFMDIQLGDGLSFSIFSQTEVKSPLIFTTAYDQYALRAFKMNSIDYLLKPIDADELRKAIEKYESLNFPSLQLSEEVLKNLMQTLQSKKYRSRFLVKMGKALKYLAVDDISMFYSEDGLAFARDLNGCRYLVEGTLEFLESTVDPTLFYRINRKVLVHIQCIVAIHPYFNIRLKLDTKPHAPFDLIVAREKASSFKKWVDGA